MSNIRDRVAEGITLNSLYGVGMYFEKGMLRYKLNHVWIVKVEGGYSSYWGGDKGEIVGLMGRWRYDNNFWNRPLPRKIDG